MGEVLTPDFTTPRPRPYKAAVVPTPEPEPVKLPPVEVSDVCKGAAESCSELLIIGTRLDGKSFAAASTPNKERLLWWIENFKAHMMRGDYDGPERPKA